LSEQALAKRVFELARELSVKSKAIVEKCKAEDIPNIQNHMSSVSAGLEATVREWFSVDSEASGTAVETAEKVDIEKVRVAPAKRARKKAASAAAPPVGGESESATAVADPPAAPTVKPVTVVASVPEEPADDSGKETTPTESEDGVAETEVRPAAKTQDPTTAPVMNVPTRPEIVKPVGPKLGEVQKPARLFGPKVIRVEAADPVEAPRPRRHTAGQD